MAQKWMKYLKNGVVIPFDPALFAAGGYEDFPPAATGARPTPAMPPPAANAAASALSNVPKKRGRPKKQTES